MSTESYDPYETEPFLQRWIKKAKNNPFMVAGLVGFTGVLIQGTRKYKSYRASGMSVSLFLIQLRVVAQGMVVGALSLALVAQAIKEYNSEQPSEERKQ